MGLVFNGTSGTDKISAVDGTLTIDGLATVASPTVTGDLLVPDKIVHTGDTNTQIRFPSVDTITAETSGSERLRIASDGKIGIGVAAPGELLHLKTASGNCKIRIDAAATPSLDFYEAGTRNSDIMVDYSSNNLIVTNRQNANITFRTNGANERLRIASTGKVLIGDGSTYSANGLLHIVGDDNSNGPELYLQVNNNNTTDNIGALWFGNNVDKSLVKLAGHTHTANNTADFTVSTSSGGTLAERLRIDSDGNIILKDGAAQGNSLVNYIRANDSSGNSQYQLGMVSSGNEDLYLVQSRNAKLRFQTNGSSRWIIDGDPGHLTPAAANTVDIGSTSAEIRNLFIGDSGQLQLGSDQDLSIYHNGSNGYLKNSTGQQLYRSGTHTFESADGSDEYVRITSEGQLCVNGTTSGVDTTPPLNGFSAYYETDQGQVTLGSYSSGGTTHMAFYTNESGNAMTQKMCLQGDGTLGLGIDTPTAGDLASGASFAIPKMMIQGPTSDSSHHLLRLNAGTDADWNAGILTINHSNDRGIAIYGGRSTGNRSWGALQSIDNIGRVTKAIEIIGDEGQGVQDLKFYTGDSTTTTERLRIAKDGEISMGTAAIASPLVQPGGLDISARGASGLCSLCVGADHASTNSQTRANSDQKDARIGMPHYTNAEEPIALVTGFSASNSNDVRLGGGTSYLNTATDLRFYTEETITTVGDADKYRVRIHNKGLYELRSADGTSGSRGWRQAFSHKAWDTDNAAALFDLHMVGGHGSVHLLWELRDSSSASTGGSGVRIGEVWVTFRGSGNDITHANCSTYTKQSNTNGTLADMTWSAAVQDTSTIRLTATSTADSSSVSVYLWGSSPHFAEGSYGISAL